VAQYISSSGLDQCWYQTALQDTVAQYIGISRLQ